MRRRLVDVVAGTIPLRCKLLAGLSGGFVLSYRQYVRGKNKKPFEPVPWYMFLNHTQAHNVAFDDFESSSTELEVVSLCS